MNPWILFNEDVFWSIISAQYFPNHILLPFVRRGTFIQDTLALFDHYMSSNLTLHDSVVKKSIEFLNGLEFRNFKWLRCDFLHNEFYDHVKTYPDYSKYLEGEDFTKRIKDDNAQNKRMRSLLRKLFKTDNSLDFLISLCSSELFKIDN